MGLESFIEEQEQYHENHKIDKEKLHVSELCPSCSDNAEHVRGTEYRCKNNRCEVLYYFSTDFEVKNNAKMY